MSDVEGWIGVDLDGTLANYGKWNDEGIGAPIPRMLERVKNWLLEGRDVRIVTARISEAKSGVNDVEKQRAEIEAWCVTHLGITLPVTCSKDYEMVELWDDRAVQVEKNTGVSIQERVIEMALLAQRLTDVLEVVGECEAEEIALIHHSRTFVDRTLRFVRSQPH